MGIGIEFGVNDTCKLKADAGNMKQAFQFIAYAQQVFGTKVCGNCQYAGDGPEGPLVLKHKQPQGYNYYSVQCPSCKYELKFGQTQEGEKLFPKGWEEPYEGGGARNNDSQDEPEEKPKAKAKAKPAKPEGDGDIPW